MGYTLPIQQRTVTRARLSGNTATTIIAAADSAIEVGLITIVNVDGTNPVDVTVDVYDGTNATRLVSTYPLAADSLPLNLEGTVLLEGESLRVTSGDANGDLHVTVQHTAPQ